MKKINAIFNYLNKPFLTHLLFWIGVFSYHVVTANRTFYHSLKEIIDAYALTTFVQIIFAYITIFILIPKFLNRKKNITFTILLILLFVSLVAVYHTSKYYYIEPKYPESYVAHFQKYGHLSVLERLSNISVIISKSVYFSSPALLLLLFRFYRNQQRLIKISEQKKTAELTALKHQLNPHFLFNTLNNLYALALKKSEQTPMVIERLSDILDYMLYRCNDKFVSLQKEIVMIENYIALEKIRYGKRVKISFEKIIAREVKIAPLLLLTFIENSFKHGVSQELKEAYISIKIELQGDEIIFNIKNSKSDINIETNGEKCIGLNNVKKQLELLYSNEYTLGISDKKNSYSVTLNLEAK